MLKVKKQKSKVRFALNWEIPTAYAVKKAIKEEVKKILNIVFYPFNLFYKGITGLFNLIKNGYLAIVGEVSKIVSALASFVQNRLYNFGLRVKAIGVVLRFIFFKPQDILFDQKRKEKFLLVSWEAKKNIKHRESKKKIRREKAGQGLGALLGFKEISSLILFGLKKFSSGLGSVMEKTGLRLVHFSRKRSRKIEKSIATFIVFAFIAQALALTIFFALNVESQEFCGVDVDVVLIMDTSASMEDGQASSQCDWWAIEWVEEEQTYKWVSHIDYSVSEEWCQAKNKPAPRSSFFTPASPKKIIAAKSAANSFIDNLGNNDQSAVVSFNNEAFLEKGLSSDHTASKTVIDNLITGGATNIGDAISFSLEEFNSELANPQANKAMILLTDGKANRPNGSGVGENQADVAYAEEKAGEAAEMGYKIFTIGLGSDSDINEVMLQNIADLTGAKYYHASNGSDLSAIYDEIAWEICQYGSISGCKYNDMNNNGAVDENEQGLAGWEIILSGDFSSAQLANENGCYLFAGLLSGSYNVSEAFDANKGVYRQTYPAQGYYQIKLAEGENAVDKNFANYFPVCGNGLLDQYDDYSEECDAGDNNGTVCSPEYGSTCSYCSNQCELIESAGSFCGDGILDTGEECDDTNNENGDGCSLVCKIETAPVPEPEPEPQPVCGDGILNSGEGCDDGNNENNDGCSAVCEIEQEPEPEPTPNPIPAPSSGGGSVPILPSLIIQQEQVETVERNRVKITWHTSIKATSRIIYNLEPGKFDPAEPPNFGYTFTTSEFDSPVNPFGVTYHEVWINSLLPKTTYYYRVVSSDSPTQVLKDETWTGEPEKVSQEHSFTTLENAADTGSLLVEPSGFSGLEDIEQEIEEISYGIGIVREQVLALAGTSFKLLTPEEPESPEIFQETPVFVEEPEISEPSFLATQEQKILEGSDIFGELNPDEASAERQESSSKSFLAGLAIIIEKIGWWVWPIALIIIYIILRVLVASKKKKPAIGSN